jgi:hypothetical protein
VDATGKKDSKSLCTPPPPEPPLVPSLPLPVLLFFLVEPASVLAMFLRRLVKAVAV